MVLKVEAHSTAVIAMIFFFAADIAMGYAIEWILGLGH